MIIIMLFVYYKKQLLMKSRLFSQQSTNKRESMKYKPKPTYNKNGSDSDLNRFVSLTFF